MMSIMTSNKLDVLFNSLKECIYNNKDPFKKLTVVFPSRNVENWFKAYWLKNTNQVLMNVNFKTMDSIIFSLVNTDRFYKLDKGYLKCLILKSLVKNIDNLPLNIKNYISCDGVIDPVKLYDTADKLASLFPLYEDDCLDYDGFEKFIYDEVYSEAYLNKYSSSYYLFNKLGKLNNYGELYFFGFYRFSKFEELIVDEYSKNHDVYLYNIVMGCSDAHYEITEAPSKLKEVEAVHSKICELIKDKNVSFSDILVMGKNMGEYEDVISRVFRQDNVSFPDIPFSISAVSNKEDDLSFVLDRLFNILVKGFFTRLDFVDLINNKLIKEVRCFSDDDIECMKESILKMNVFRDSDSFKDWEYAKKRMVLSLVSNINNVDDSVVELHDGKYLPFSTISLDNDLMFKFIGLIDDLNEWISINNKYEYICDEYLDCIDGFIRKFVFDDIKYKGLFDVIRNYRSASLSGCNIPIKTLLYDLISVKCGNKKNSGIFSNGVSFVEFSKDYVISSKYIFFINCSSKNLPVIESKNELDERCIDDYDIYRDMFFLEYHNCDDFFVSFVNKNLKTDEDFYPSSYLLELIGDIEYKDVKKNVLNIDETRSWDKLYTKKEFKDKAYFKNILSTDLSKDDDISYDYECIKKLKVRDIEAYLEEPLMAKTKFLFGNSYDDEGKINSEYEPFSFNDMERAVLVNEIIVDLLKDKNAVRSLIDNEYNVDLVKVNDILISLYSVKGSSYSSLNEVEEFLVKEFELLYIKHKVLMIDLAIGVEYYLSLFKLVIDSVKKLLEVSNGNYEIIKMGDLKLSYNNDNWVLCSVDYIGRYIDSDGKRYYFDLRKSSTNTVSSFLRSYVYSLMDVAGGADGDYNIVIFRGALSTDYSICKSDAISILNKIYEKLNDYSENYVLPSKFFKKDFEKELMKDGFADESKFKDIINNKNLYNGNWKFFDDAVLFDLDKDTGYDMDDKVDYFIEKNKEHLELIKFIK